MTKAFISYSWDSPDHSNWVLALATRLRADGVDVVLDQWHLALGDQLPEFMERSVRESDYVLIICTQRYKQRSDNRTGGVGYEGHIMTAEALTNPKPRKMIPILREAPWVLAAPGWLAGKYHADLSGAPYADAQYQDLLSTLLGTKPKAPPLGKQGAASSGQANTSPSGSAVSAAPQFQLIKITGIVIDQVGSPRNDGTRGSALYRVPFQLSAIPPSEWRELFIEAWNHPSSFTTMHRPGIASIVRDTVVLDGTSLEEVERYHRDTLMLAATEANQRYQQWLEVQQAARDRQQQQAEQHRREVDDIPKRIKFD
jgi:hypothetical protein